MNNGEQSIVVRSREDWKRAIATYSILKRLGKIGIVGGPDCMAQPYEVLNQWTLTFALDDEDQFITPGCNTWRVQMGR